MTEMSAILDVLQPLLVSGKYIFPNLFVIGFWKFDCRQVKLFANMVL